MNNYYGRQNETIYIIFSIFVKGGTYYQSINISTGNTEAMANAINEAVTKNSRFKIDGEILAIYFKPSYFLKVLLFINSSSF